MKKKALTLLELMVVVMIAGILAGLALPNYFQSQENAWTEEAMVNLKQIRSAEMFYRMERGYYATWSGSADHTGDINNALSLALPIASAKWRYNVITDPAGMGNSVNFTAKAQRVGAGARNYCINQNLSIKEPSQVNCTW